MSKEMVEALEKIESCSSIGDYYKIITPKPAPVAEGVVMAALKETLLVLTHTVSNERRYNAIKNANAIIAAAPQEGVPSEVDRG